MPSSSVNILDLPLELFQTIIDYLFVDEFLGTMRKRLVCKTFSKEILDAVFRLNEIEDVARFPIVEKSLSYQTHLTTRWIYERAVSRHKSPSAVLVRRIAQAAAQNHNESNYDQFLCAACSCLGTLMGGDIFTHLPKDHDNTEDAIQQCCVTLAAYMNDMDFLRSYHGPPIPECTWLGRPLAAAAVKGNLDAVEHLLSKGLTAQSPSSFYTGYINLNANALCAAAYGGYENIIEMLLRPQFQFDAESERGEEDLGRAIDHAAQGNHTKIMTSLLERYRVVNPQGYQKAIDYSLRKCCIRGSFDTASILIDLGANTRQEDDKPRNLLQWAARSGNAQLVQLLVEKGTSLMPTPHLRGKPHIHCPRPHALDEAQIRGHKGVVEVLQKALAKLPPDQAFVDYSIRQACWWG